MIDCVIRPDKTTNGARNFGFVTYLEAHTAHYVSSLVHLIDENIVSCRKAKRPPKKTSPFGSFANDPQFKTSKIFVGGLPQDLSKAELEEYFSQFGTIVESYIISHPETRQSRCFGFVQFTTCKAVEDVIARYSEIYLKGKWIECKKALPKEACKELERNGNLYLGMMRRGLRRGRGLCNRDFGGGGCAAGDRRGAKLKPPARDDIQELVESWKRKQEEIRKRNAAAENEAYQAALLKNEIEYGGVAPRFCAPGFVERNRRNEMEVKGEEGYSGSRSRADFYRSGPPLYYYGDDFWVDKGTGSNFVSKADRDRAEFNKMKERLDLQEENIYYQNLVRRDPYADKEVGLRAIPKGKYRHLRVNKPLFVETKKRPKIEKNHFCDFGGKEENQRPLNQEEMRKISQEIAQTLINPLPEDQPRLLKPNFHFKKKGFPLSHRDQNGVEQLFLRPGNPRRRIRHSEHKCAAYQPDFKLGTFRPF